MLAFQGNLIGSLSLTNHLPESGSFAEWNSDRRKLLFAIFFARFEYVVFSPSLYIYY